MKKILGKLESFGYLISQAFAGIFRNGALSFASVAVLVACLLITGSFFLIIANINYNMDSTDYLNRMVVYIKEDATTEQTASVFDRVLANKKVKEAFLVTKEDALKEEMEKHPEYFAALEDGDNPYRDSIIITYMNSESAAGLAEELESMDLIASVTSRSEIAGAISSIKHILSALSAGFFIALTVVTVFIIITTIRVTIFSRKSEIALMRMIGATKTFIVTPFLLEGFILGVTAAAIAFFVQSWLYGGLRSLTVSGYELLDTISFSALSPYILAGFFGVGIITGMLGSAVSLGKYMKA